MHLHVSAGEPVQPLKVNISVKVQVVRPGNMYVYIYIIFIRGATMRTISTTSTSASMRSW